MGTKIKHQIILCQIIFIIKHIFTLLMNVIAEKLETFQFAALNYVISSCNVEKHFNFYMKS
jgi:hypothetical protein